MQRWVGISKVRKGGLAVVSGRFFKKILRKVRLSKALTPAHEDGGELLRLLVHRVRSMYLGVEAQ